MKATANIDRTEITHNLDATPNGYGDIGTLQDRDAKARAGQETARRGQARERTAGGGPAQGPHSQGTGQPDGRQLQLPVPGQQRAQALDPHAAGKG